MRAWARRRSHLIASLTMLYQHIFICIQSWRSGNAGVGIMNDSGISIICGRRNGTVIDVVHKNWIRSDGEIFIFFNGRTLPHARTNSTKLPLGARRFLHSSMEISTEIMPIRWIRRLSTTEMMWTHSCASINGLNGIRLHAAQCIAVRAVWKSIFYRNVRMAHQVIRPDYCTATAILIVKHTISAAQPRTVS